MGTGQEGPGRSSPRFGHGVNSARTVRPKPGPSLSGTAARDEIRWRARGLIAGAKRRIPPAEEWAHGCARQPDSEFTTIMRPPGTYIGSTSRSATVRDRAESGYGHDGATTR